MVRICKYAAVAVNFSLVGVSTGMDNTVYLELNTERNIAVATFKSGCISDVEAITAAGRQIKAFIDENHPNRLIFDFGEVKFFSSQVLGLLLEIRAKLQAGGGEVVIGAINPQLHRVFKITNLDKIFRFFADNESAVKAISAE